MTDETLGVVCGQCGGTIYMETCEIESHDWAIASECQQCGERHLTPSGCLDCHAEFLRSIIRQHEFRGWENDPDSARCGACGVERTEHPYPFAYITSTEQRQLGRALTALLNIIEDRH